MADWQAAGTLLAGCPAALTAPLEMIQAPGWPRTRVALNAIVVGLIPVMFAQHDRIVADSFQVTDQVRRQHDADMLIGDGFHQVLEKFATGQRIEAGYRLVQDEQLRSFAVARVSASWARCPPDSVPAFWPGSRSS
jgi:hypothetical protein